jgi:hypothetical protein
MYILKNILSLIDKCQQVIHALYGLIGFNVGIGVEKAACQLSIATPRYGVILTCYGQIKALVLEMQRDKPMRRVRVNDIWH